ncbi:MAG: DedA family protein [Rhodospirillales bacterium]|nr:DedA family protein [Rhodospirillales bacterium]MBO6788502.1 DedA family protein [Rhodospirillales bacterium]
MLRALYDKTLEWSAHRHAIWILALVSFAESSFFLIPPDVLLIPMVLAARTKWFRIALVCTLASVAGGVFGYFIGAFLFDEIGRPILDIYHASAKFDAAREAYNENGVWIVFTAGFSPIPYKIFTIASGVTSMDIVPFIIASAVGRGARFFLVAILLWKFGEPIRAFIEKRLGLLTLAFCALLVLGVIAIKFLA